MTAHPVRRRADHFNSLVEGSSAAGVRDAVWDESLLLVDALRATPTVAARPEFVLDLRERLMLAAAAEPARPTSLTARDQTLTTPPAKRRRERRVAVAIGGFAIIGATTSMALAAQSALPGSTLYPVKTTLEGVHSDLTVGDSAKGQVILHDASGRLDEVDALSQHESTDPAVIEQTLTTFSAQANQASDLLLANYASSGNETSITELRTFTAASLRTLTLLDTVVPTSVHQSLVTAARTLIAIDDAAITACPTCTVAGVSIPPVLAGHPVAPTPPVKIPAPKPVRVQSSTTAAPTTLLPSPSPTTAATPSSAPSDSTTPEVLPQVLPTTTPSPQAGSHASGSSSATSGSSSSSSGSGSSKGNPIKDVATAVTGNGSSGTGGGGGDSLPGAVASAIASALGDLGGLGG